MPGPNIQGTFATGATASVGNAADVLNVHSSITSMKLTITGLDGSNTVKTRKRTTSSAAWADQTTYNSNQTATVVTVAANEEWQLVQVTQQATKDITYKMSLES